MRSQYFRAVQAILIGISEDFRVFMEVLYAFRRFEVVIRVCHRYKEVFLKGFEGI